ncbi:hypothetical protein [Geminicoccus flavidas]|uniref:hypothetical protein n=1 Tax=Geminicoccus flavidas TaxID=2506407 RepID=UPI00135B8A75|nr:hypothetical protein [Geminicoccus flavidas]
MTARTPAGLPDHATPFRLCRAIRSGSVSHPWMNRQAANGVSVTPMRAGAKASAGFGFPVNAGRHLIHGRTDGVAFMTPRAVPLTPLPAPANR